MLVDEDNANIFPFLGELFESGLDGCSIGLVVHDQEILLCIGASRYVLSGLLGHRLLILET